MASSPDTQGGKTIASGSRPAEASPGKASNAASRLATDTAPTATRSRPDIASRGEHGFIDLDFMNGPNA